MLPERSTNSHISKRAIQIEQSPGVYIYMFSLNASEILQVANISRISRNYEGELIGYQRGIVKEHVSEIAEYLNSDDVIFPNPIIIALDRTTKFIASRGPGVSDGTAMAGTLRIPLNSNSNLPGWIVDGQQRTIALTNSKRNDLPIAVTAFITNSVELQRDQFIRINNAKPLPRAIVNELLPEIELPLSPKLSLRKLPSELCNFLNQADQSPFKNLIRRPTTTPGDRKLAVITDSSVINMINESLKATGSLFPYRNTANGSVDFEGIIEALLLYWGIVKDTFPESWGSSAKESRLMHGVGIRSMGRLMDRVLIAHPPQRKESHSIIQRELEFIKPYCRWSSGTWDSLGTKWNDIQNVPRHINEISNLLVRLHFDFQARL